MTYTPRGEEEGGGVNVGFGPLLTGDEQAYSVVNTSSPSWSFVVVGSYSQLSTVNEVNLLKTAKQWRPPV